ncbi:hypothetical protein [Novosphingobium album (ex Liu et al. 2023)]|uniref:DUF2486 family protein n=1 Tax=Novosphingobium album (ex Liu et al. 2023) TaxID=3031130 RepID=A0ABT5WRI2_9SPHN|nr:hypothetical protein [Novosphingobium album (ex Liu et al. 2023)]MDE8651598.1 hypothetical protein [Novosphingobium album (ex Liu et al. 2023)]
MAERIDPATFEVFADGVRKAVAREIATRQALDQAIADRAEAVLAAQDAWGQLFKYVSEVVGLLHQDVAGAAAGIRAPEEGR